MRDHRITVDEYFKNNGYSSHHFIKHFKYFYKNMPKWLEMKVYRSKIKLLNINNRKQVILHVHFNGRSDKYMTILNKSGTNELATMRCDLSPNILRNVTLSFLR